jgi:hypothetical protein
MKTILSFLLLVLVSSGAFAQVIGRVDKKNKEFSVASNQPGDYRVFGFQYANITTKKMICFSSHVTDVKDNYNNCPLGAYFDSDKLKIGDKIVYLGALGTFGKMNFISGTGKKTIFYLPKTSFSIK